MKMRLSALVALVVSLGACSRPQPVRAGDGTAGPEDLVHVGVAAATRKPIMRQITISSELVPYQETDVFAKESGYVKDLLVDYGSRVKKGDLMAVLDIPELAIQLKQDDAAIANAGQAVTHAQHELGRLEAQLVPLQAQYNRLAGVAQTRPGLVAQQEIDDAQGKSLAMAAQVEAGKSALQSAESQLDEAKAKLERDKALFDYARITAPFDGVVTQRYANLGSLMQAGTNSSTQAMPLVRLSEDDVFRLVIPVPESYVKYIRIGDPVEVRVTSLDRTVTGVVKRFSADVAAETRTMHTEVELQNPSHILLPGLYAEATLTLEHKASALVTPLQSISQSGELATVLVVDSGGVLREQKVTLGLQTATDAEILSGLKEGDQVVVSDRSGLKAGLHVKPQVVEMPRYPSGTMQ